MCETNLYPSWTIRLNPQEMRTVCLALSGRIKPDTPEAGKAVDLLKLLNEQRLTRLNEMMETLERLDASLD